MLLSGVLERDEAGREEGERLQEMQGFKVAVGSDWGDDAVDERDDVFGAAGEEQCRDDEVGVDLWEEAADDSGEFGRSVRFYAEVSVESTGAS